ncbi:TrmB family transcriptional regulator [Thermoplasmatales archaeon ex4484_36]|nr:MAG: TrmB family transcriptional regulator [Thermoplasmatales archaeon ex4484_36]RLF55924.1 MAG: TrmB family transcriptional regulator [Thermoplasmata archaeon]RLF70267.1 MAG: TrmB family transcriptional regulator [Thermoplasmata archaeon]
MEDIDLFGITREELRREMASLVADLKIFGLTEYETRAYLALLVQGASDAESVAKLASLPRTSSYKALEGLVQKGWAMATEGRPRIFRPEPPEILQEIYSEKINSIFDRLSTLSEMVAEKGNPQLIFTITGEEKVLKKIAELIKGAQKEVWISTPSLLLLKKKMRRLIKQAESRGVRIVVITSPGQGEIPGAEVHYREGLLATDIIADGDVALIAASDFSACGYTDNPLLSQHLVRFLQMMLGSGGEE